MVLGPARWAGASQVPKVRKQLYDLAPFLSRLQRATSRLPLWLRFVSTGPPSEPLAMLLTVLSTKRKPTLVAMASTLVAMASNLLAMTVLTLLHHT